MTDAAQGSSELPATHLSYDLEEARAKYARSSFLLHHGLAESPLFELDALADLAERLPDESVERNAGNRDLVVGKDALPQVRARPADLVRGIGENPGFITLPTTVPGVPRQPEYQELFEQILDDLAPMIPGGRAAMHDHHAVIVISSGGNTTPVHVDPEPSFLLHIRGVKRFSIGRHPDPEVEQRELEAFYAHEGHYLPVVPVDPLHFDLAPGEAVHVPPVQPHWVKNGPEVAISFSVGFQTAADHRRRGVHQWNRRMRRLGLEPKPHGQDDLRDRIKGQLMGSAFEARRRLLRRPR